MIFNSMERACIITRNFSELVQMVYNHRISKVDWVSNMNYKEQGSEAEIVYENLDKLR